MKRARCADPPRPGPAPTPTPTPTPRQRRRGFSRRRALGLLAVHLLFGLHLAHWKVSGRTLAPLELNEVMYTLELGIVTAGAIFMGLVLVSVLFFGRFFCSWGCHVLALQDLCAWSLGKLGIRPKPLRSRVLVLVPMGAAFYMFVWPQLARAWAGKPLPTLTVSQAGWDSFLTEDFWRNLPPPGVALATLFVCGFVIVYLLGSRSFCRSICPYGAVFSLADRLAPGRIVSTGPCQSCGACTAGCSSGVRVHEELAAYGTVVDPACLKDLDCIAVCPLGSIGYRFTRPALLRRKRAGSAPIRRQWHFAAGEEWLVAGIFLISLPILRGLYGLVPFFLAMASSALVALGAVVALRTFRRRGLSFGGLVLVEGGRRTASGWGALLLAGGALVFLAHSALVRYHLALGERAYARVLAGGSGADRATALERLGEVERLGLLRTPGLELKLGHLLALGATPGRAEPYLRAHLARSPGDLEARLELARVLERGGRLRPAEREVGEALARFPAADDPAADDPARRHLRAKALALEGSLRARRGEHAGALASYGAALELEPGRAPVHLALAELESLAGRLERAAAHLARALELEPGVADAQYNLAVLLSRLGDREGAVRHYREALRLDPAAVEAANNLGFLLAAGGEAREAEELFRRAIALAPGYAPAHFNLGTLLAERGLWDQAQESFAQASRIDPRYEDAHRRGR